MPGPHGLVEGEPDGAMSLSQEEQRPSRRFLFSLLLASGSRGRVRASRGPRKGGPYPKPAWRDGLTYALPSAGSHKDARWPLRASEPHLCLCACL